MARLFRIEGEYRKLINFLNYHDLRVKLRGLGGGGGSAAGAAP
jgi:hypothetical protein